MIGRGIGIPFRHGTSGGGTSIPPEIKKSIVAWYSPYKQKLTNYDVIEAYIEDFTKWAYRDSRGTAKITNNTIVITNVVETNNIVEDSNKPYSDLTIRVTGVTENKYLIVRQGRGKLEAHIKKDGVYAFKDNNLYFGFGVSVIGECNITITQLPTSILKDFSGNGNHAYLYGGKGKLNSGMGVYQTDFTTWSKTNFDVHPEYIIATNINIDKDNSIVYQTKNKYNEQTIYPGDKQDTDTLFIGTIRKDDSRSFIGCHGDILIFNRTLTEYEISWVKNNMMCSKQQEPDIDL